MKTSLPIPIILTILAGCGDASQSSSVEDATLDPTSSVEAPVIIADNSMTETMSIAEEALLPLCDLENTNQLIYIEVSEKFKKCSYDKWIDVKVKGEKKSGDQVLIKIANAEPTQCPHGGKVIQTGKDINNSGELEIPEVLTAEPVCNGATGATGAKGEQGEKGEQGIQGMTGAKGESGENYSAKAFELYKEYRKSIFYLTIKFYDGSYVYSTGFLCDDIYICTAFHPLKPHNQIEFVDASNTYNYIDTLNDQDAFLFRVPDPAPHADPYSDLAKIYIGNNTALEGLKSLPIEYGYYRPDATSPTLVMSFMMGMADLFTDIGTVLSNYVGTCGDAGWPCIGLDYDFITSNDTDHGSSGAPVFDLTTGMVVGVVIGGPTPTLSSANWTWVNLASSFDDL